MVDPKNRLLSLAENSKCLYIQYRVLNDVACQMYDIFTKGKIKLFEGVGVGARFLMHDTRSMRF